MDVQIRAIYESSYLNMKKFVETRLDPNKEMLIIDIGSQNVGGYLPPYRNLRDRVKILDNLLRWKEQEKAQKSEAENGKIQKAV